jgi:ATP-dependent protease HslVU (ClpYQ) peptidase subunit
MTLCIAAKTFDSFGSADLLVSGVVTCYDRRVETATAHAETAYKCNMLSDQWLVMKAGVLAPAIELTHIFEQQLDVNNPHGISAIERLRYPINIFKKRAAERFTQSRYAVSREDFMANGRAWLGEQLFREALFEMKAHIAQEENQVQLILVGRDDEDFLAIYKYSYGELTECEDFAAIGSGETIAEAALYQRRVEALFSLPQMAYAVYEAKRLGEITPGVGVATMMSTLEVNENEREGRRINWRHVTQGGLGFLERQFRDKFGPRPYEYTRLPEGFVYSDGVTPDDPEAPGLTTRDPSELTHYRA